MKSVAVWITALALIVISIVTWIVITPPYTEQVAFLDEEIGTQLEGDAKESYEYVRNSGTNILRISPAIFTVVYIVWAFLSMQQEETYSGAYYN